MAEAATPAPGSAKSAAKVELLAEAIENLCMGVSANALEKVGGKPSALVTQFLADARADIRVRLRAFLQPTLTLLDNGPRQPYPPEVPLDERVKCGRCKRHFPCAAPNCLDWHRAIKAAINKPIPSTDDDDEPPDVAA